MRSGFAALAAAGAAAGAAGPAAAQTCYANCDGSVVQPVINVADYVCFQTRYTLGESYANCDRSTTPPVLNVADFLCFINSVVDGCPTEPVTNGAAPRAILRSAPERRIALVRLGDSNQLALGSGWDHGFQKAAAERYGLYCTPLFSHNENGGYGAGIGYGCFAYTPNQAVGLMEGPSPFWAGHLALLDDPGLMAHRMSWLPWTLETPVNSGILLEEWWPGDISGNLRYSIWTGRFTAGGGSFRPGWARFGGGPTLQMHGSGPWPTGPAPSEGIVRLDTDLPAGERNFWVRASPIIPGEANIVGPYLSTYQCVTNRDRLTGIGSHTFFSAGGRSLFDYAYGLQNAPDRTISHFFDCVRQTMTQVGQPPRMIVLIDGGLNDRVELAMSVGPSPAPSSSAAGFRDNARAIVGRLRAVLLADGWGPEEFCFVLSATHPVDDNPWGQFENLQTGYRAALVQMATQDGDVAALDLSRLTTASEMLALGYYSAGGSDRNHLTQAGFEDLAGRILDALAR